MLKFLIFLIISLPCMAQELTVSSSHSYGNYRVFGYEEGVKVYSYSIEYDTSFFHKHLLGSTVEWAMEVLPTVALSEYSHADGWGVVQGTDRRNIFGIGVSPVGYKLIWKQHRVKPYLIAKGTVLVFDHKPLAPNTTYENWSAQFGTGLQITLDKKWDLRLGLFQDTHFSNAHIVANNPGTDFMSSSIGLTYKF